MRGKGRRELRTRNRRRIIPAHAGKSKFAIDPQAENRDHPRSCGEKAILASRAQAQAGSSPLMRGKDYSDFVSKVHLRIIPAHAGKRWELKYLFWEKRDHPRSCGEKEDLFELQAWGKGSSPLMRGKANRGAEVSFFGRIIPAHAGKSAQRSLNWPLIRDHPRSCGEKNLRMRRSNRVPGSSPLMRGKDHYGGPERLARRIIPAHAGKSK